MSASDLYNDLIAQPEKYVEPITKALAVLIALDIEHRRPNDPP